MRHVVTAEGALRVPRGRGGRHTSSHGGCVTRRARAGGRLARAGADAELRLRRRRRRARARLSSDGRGRLLPRCGAAGAARRAPPSLEAIATGTPGRTERWDLALGALALRLQSRSAASSEGQVATTSRSPARGRATPRSSCAPWQRRPRRSSRGRGGAGERACASTRACRRRAGSHPAHVLDHVHARRARRCARRPRAARRSVERLEDLPLAALACVRARRRSRVRPVAELVGVEVLELDAAPVGQRRARRVASPTAAAPSPSPWRSCSRARWASAHGSTLRSEVEVGVTVVGQVQGQPRDPDDRLGGSPAARPGRAARTRGVGEDHVAVPLERVRVRTCAKDQL